MVGWKLRTSGRDEVRFNGQSRGPEQHHAADADFLRTDEQDLTHDDWTRWTDLWRQYAAEYAESTQG